MIEAKPTDVGLGCILDIHAYGDTKCQHTTGFQKIQLRNAGTSKRIIRIHQKSRSLSVCSNANCHTASVSSLSLTRISARFAMKRIHATIEKIGKNRKYLKSSTIGLNILYERYSQLCPTPTINSCYEGLYKSGNTPLDSALSKSYLKDYFEIIYLDSEQEQKQLHSRRSSHIILTTKEVQATEKLQDTLVTIIENSEKNECLWYTDNDYFDEKGKRSQARFKPCINKGLLQQGNYVGPMLICKRELFTRLGEVDMALCDSAILLFLLKAFDSLDESAITRLAHISYSVPYIHYHAPHGLYRGKYDKQAFEKYLANREVHSSYLVAGIYPKTWTVKPRKVDPEPSVNIIIATRDRIDLLKECVDSIMKITRYENYTITVVDNNSTEPETHTFHQRMSESCRYRKIDYPGAFNYSAINNMAAAESEADLLVLLNNDTQVLEADWLEKIVAQLEDREIACVGTRLIYSTGLLQHAGIVTGLLEVAGHIHQFATREDDGYGARIRLSCDVTAVTGACLGIRRAVYEELGGLDEVNLAVAYNDVDLCLRARNAGYRNHYLADVTLVHHESVSRGTDTSPAKKARFLSESMYMKSTHKRWLENDPAWHPEFSNAHTTPLLSRSSTFMLHNVTN